MSVLHQLCHPEQFQNLASAAVNQMGIILMVNTYHGTCYVPGAGLRAFSYSRLFSPH